MLMLCLMFCQRITPPPNAPNSPCHSVSSHFAMINLANLSCFVPYVFWHSFSPCRLTRWLTICTVYSFDLGFASASIRYFLLLNKHSQIFAML